MPLCLRKVEMGMSEQFNPQLSHLEVSSEYPLLLTVSSRVRKWRIYQNISDQAFAELCLLTLRELKLFEMGRYDPSLRQLTQIAEVLGIELADLTEE